MNINDIFTAKRDLSGALANLAEALTCSEVYNVDFVAIKEQVNWALDSAWDKYVRATYLAIDPDLRHSYCDAVQELYYNHPQSHTLGGTDKKTVKAEKADPSNVVTLAAREFVEATRQLAEDMKAVKLLVVKTRKPSATPRKTKARTIENTGTCAVCDRNVKLAGGLIVAHGYRIVWNQQSANCPGANHPPIEVSPSGAQVQIMALTNWINRELVISAKCSNAAKLPSNDPAVQKDMRIKTAQAESNIKHGEYEIKRLQAKVDGWEPRSLPGA